MDEQENRFLSFVRQNFVGEDDYEPVGLDDFQSKVVSTRLPIEDATRLELLAPYFGMSKSAFIAHLLDMALSEVYKNLGNDFSKSIEIQVYQSTGLPNETTKISLKEESE